MSQADDDVVDDPASARRRGPNGLRALDRAMSILFTLAAHPTGMTLADAARQTGLTLTTVHRMVMALRRQKLTRETPGGLQALGPSTLVLARGFLGGLDFRVEALPVLSELRDLTNETCHLGTLAPPHVVYVDKLDSTHSVQVVTRIGATVPALTTALGRAILAHSPAATVDVVIEATRAQLGRSVDRDEVDETLRGVRERGYSLDRGENDPRVSCAGAPVLDQSGEVLAAISVSVPTERFSDARTDTMGSAVRDAARRISTALGYVGDTGATR